MKNTIVISVGGSLIVPDQIDIDFLKKFKALIKKHTQFGKKFILVAGGGKTARNYQSAAKKFDKVSTENLDQIGIQTTIINAHLLKTVFGKDASEEIIQNPNHKIDSKKKILIASGWKSGCSSDYNAVLLAINIGAKQIINLSNIDYVYDKDPGKFKDAKKLVEVSWKDFRKIVGSKWNPGLNVPFDPIASRQCEKEKIKVIIANGKNIANLDKILLDQKFIGTHIY